MPPNIPLFLIIMLCKIRVGFTSRVSRVIMVINVIGLVLGTLGLGVRVRIENMLKA